jgi:hypothetical protein
MKGKVFDADTQKPIGASFELIDLATGKPVVNSTSNPGTGGFIVCLPTGKSYALNVSKDGYLFYSENFELKDARTSAEPFDASNQSRGACRLEKYLFRVQQV